MADFIPWPPPPSDPVKGAVLQAARAMRDSVLVRTITLGELEQFARAVLAAPGVAPAQPLPASGGDKEKT